MTDTTVSPIVLPQRKLIYRHRLVVRITHWINAVAMICLFMSGLQIFNAHPALYWGAKSTFDDPIMSIDATMRDDHTREGITSIFGHEINTTGVLGLSGKSGHMQERAFPAWITLPSPSPELAMGRLWHFFFAWILVLNGLVYLGSSLINRHLQRDIVPTPKDLTHIGHDIKDHLLFRFPKGEAARHYNVLQKLAYFGVLCVLAPLIVLAGLAMSPRMDAGFPILLHMFDGRQSARTVHFVIAFLLLGFVFIHVFMVIVSGLFNNLRSMITGWYAIDKTENAHE